MNENEIESNIRLQNEILRNKDSQEVVNEVNNDHYLFACTILVDGLRKFIDIPIFCEKDSFPQRNSIFKFTCDILNIEPDQELFSNFTVLNIIKFESKEKYDSFISVN